MATDLKLRCSCGSMHGVVRGVAPEAGNRIVCYCTDCQVFAQFLGQADDVLNAKGGTDIFQLSPARVSITEGHEHLACVRLTAKGLRRWYASCCNTPIGNTLAKSKPPFLGLMHSFTDHEGDGRSRDATAGPVRAHVNGSVGFVGRDGQALGFLSKAGVLWHTVKIMFGSWIRSEHRPSAFFDDSGTPRASATILAPSELARLKQEVEARSTEA